MLPMFDAEASETQAKNSKTGCFFAPMSIALLFLTGFGTLLAISNAATELRFVGLMLAGAGVSGYLLMIAKWAVANLAARMTRIERQNAAILALLRDHMFGEGGPDETGDLSGDACSPTERPHE